MSTNYVGPSQRARYVGQIGKAYTGANFDNLVPVIVVGVRGQNSRVKLTVQFADASTAEIPLNLYVEPATGFID